MNYMTVRRPVATVSNGLNSLSSFDRLFDSVFNGVPGWDARKPAVDIRADEQQYTIEADLPGMTEDRIDIRVEDNLLVIASVEEETGSQEKSVTDNGSAEPTRNGDTSGNSYVLRERRSGPFHRSFALPKDADPGKIDAAFRNGVLTVTLQKKAEAKPRQIKIKRG
jgi:HSP20 family protein